MTIGKNVGSHNDRVPHNSFDWETSPFDGWRNAGDNSARRSRLNLGSGTQISQRLSYKGRIGTWHSDGQAGSFEHIPSCNSSSSIIKDRTGILRRALFYLASVNLHDGFQELHGVSFGPLEGIAADDGAKPSTVPDGACFVRNILIIALRAPTGEAHTAMAVKGALNNVSHALGQGADGNTRLSVSFLRFG